MLYVGIDPGKTGAVCSFSKEPTVTKCPDTVTQMAAVLKAYDPQKHTVIIEKVGAMPNQGVSSMFSFGQNFGQWQGIIAALGFRCVEVSPQKWQKLIPNLPAPHKRQDGQPRSSVQREADKRVRKKAILDYAQKRLGVPIHLYAADAVALALLGKDLTT